MGLHSKIILMTDADKNSNVSVVVLKPTENGLFIETSLKTFDKNSGELFFLVNDKYATVLNVSKKTITSYLSK